MAPEAIKNESMDFRVDVFSFGIMMWEVMMQEKPFKNYLNVRSIDYAIAHDGKR
jgi:serine/threonine protein kinase